MTRASNHEQGLVLDEALDQLELPAAGGSATGELSDLVEMALLVRTYAQAPGAGPIDWPQETAETETRRNWARLARVAAVVLLVLGLAVGLLVARLDQSTARPTGQVPRDCLSSVRLVGEGVSSIPTPARRDLVNAARAWGDPCPSQGVAWGKVGGAVAESLEGARSAYLFELRGHFRLNPLRGGKSSGRLSVEWTEKASGAGTGATYPGTHLEHRLFMEPSSPPSLPRAVARALPIIGSSFRYRMTTLSVARHFGQLARWRMLPGRTPLWAAAVGSGPSVSLNPGVVTRMVIAVRTPAGTQIDRRPTDQVVQGLLAAHTSTYYFPIRLPAKMPSWFAGDVYDNTFAHSAVEVPWVATTAGHLRAVDPFESAIPEELPKNALVVIAHTAQGKGSNWFVVSKLGSEAPSTFGFGGSPLDGLSLSKFGRLRYHRIAHPRHSS